MSPKEDSKSRGVKQEQSRGLKYNAIGAEKVKLKFKWERLGFMNLFFFQFWRLLIICGTKRSSEVLDSVSKQRKAYSSPFRHRVRYLLWNGVSFFYSSYLVQLLYLLEINICLETPLSSAYTPSSLKVMTWIDWRMQRGMRINWREIEN